MLINVIFFISRNDDIVITSWWQNDDAVMKAKGKKLYVILFLLLKIIIWAVLNVIACCKMILFHLLLFNDISRNLGFFKIGFGLLLKIKDNYCPEIFTNYVKLIATKRHIIPKTYCKELLRYFREFSPFPQGLIGLK